MSDKIQCNFCVHYWECGAIDDPSCLGFKYFLTPLNEAIECSKKDGLVPHSNLRAGKAKTKEEEFLP